MITRARYQVGDRIGGVYRVYDVLKGGMGEVYICQSIQHKMAYALKTFRSEFVTNYNFRKIFDAEITTWIALEKHPNIVRCLFVDTFNGQPFMFLELIVGEQPGQGPDLRSLLRRQTLTSRQVLDFAIDICRG